MFEDQVENCFSFDGWNGRNLTIKVTCRYPMVFVYIYWERVTNLDQFGSGRGSQQTGNQMGRKRYCSASVSTLNVGYSHLSIVSAITSSNWNKRRICQILWLVFDSLLSTKSGSCSVLVSWNSPGVLLASALQIGRCHGYSGATLGTQWVCHFSCIIFHHCSPLSESVRRSIQFSFDRCPYNKIGIQFFRHVPTLPVTVESSSVVQFRTSKAIFF